jgi:predicted hydrocarbon binding protein
MVSYKPSCKKFNSLLEQTEYHKEKGEIRIAGTDWILMSASTFRDLVKGTERMLGSGGVVIWLEVGQHAGKEFAKALLMDEKEPEELQRLAEVFFTQCGWGKIQTKMNLAKKEAFVTIRNSATSRQIQSKEPVCHFIRGFIAGICDVIFNDSTECIETKCMAKGDALCEFRVKRRWLS